MRSRSTLVVVLAVLLVAATTFVVLYDSGDPEKATVMFADDESGNTLAVVQANVSDNFNERYTGLSNTDSLDENEGMLFVHPREATHGYVMRGMDFAIDIVFVAENGTITTIHHAELPPDGADSPTYKGYGKYVVELPSEYTTEHGIELGDQVKIPDEYRKAED